MSDLYVAVPPAPKFTEEPSVPLNDRVLRHSKVFPLLTVRIAEGAFVIDRPLRVVAVAIPRLGLFSVGEVRVLFVRTWVSSSVTRRFLIDPS